MTRAPAAAVTGLALCLLAAGFAVPALYVPGVALLLLAAGARLTLLRPPASLGMRRTPEAATVPEGGDLTVTLRLRRPRLLGAGWIESASGARRRLPRGRERAFTLRLHGQRRGRCSVVPARVHVGDPLGMCGRVFEFPPVDLLVLPRIEPVAMLAEGAGRGLGAAGRLAANVAALEVDGLRPHRQGAPASRIHWPTVARTGTLIERRLTDQAERLPLVVIDALRPADDDALDRALRAAASLCVHLARSGGCSLLLPGERRAVAIDPDLHAWPPLHARLALVAAGDAPGAVAAQRAGTLLWVTARSDGPPPGLVRAGAGMRYLVTPFPRPGRAAAFAVAGCTGQLLRSAGEAQAA